MAVTSQETVDLDAQQKKNRPKDTRLRQQKLSAWQPILTAKAVVPVFITISLLFVPIGIVLVLTSNAVRELAFYYDVECEEQLRMGANHCVIEFALDEDFLGNVYFYYELENYYQNHRRYMRSRNDLQLMGQLAEVAECAPFDSMNGMKIAPCGSIANSMFNDTFKLKEPTTGMEIAWSHEELVWPSDRTKFINPKCANGDCQNSQELCSAFEGYDKPPNWKRRPCELDPTNASNSGLQNADFIIWMRTAAFPDFRKPYRKLTDPAYSNGLPRGKYLLEIEYNYHVSIFSGRKSFVVSTTSWMGGRNPFLGFAYIGVGVLCALIGFVFIFIHIKYGHSLQEVAVVVAGGDANGHMHTQ